MNVNTLLQGGARSPGADPGGETNLKVYCNLFSVYSVEVYQKYRAKSIVYFND